VGAIARRLHRAGNQELAKPIDIPMSLDLVEARIVLETAFQARFDEVLKKRQERRDRLRQGNSLQRFWGKFAKDNDTGPYDALGNVELGWRPNWDAERHLQWKGDVVLVGFIIEPKAALARRSITPGWLAAVKVAQGQAELALLKWTVGDDGKIKNRDHYVNLVAWVEQILTGDLDLDEEQSGQSPQ
jgi:hypothetical protein